ncbi:hypothetical protein [Argonema antarcticum]|uniref:hypothetical protein n=1 Tax=Argonema antarcticum TaxID=2942763 RepID=UPI00201158E5|nr:hypothetical protein [Argonema antarcticum]MCL1469800.1 hypothetical protein [Argonema antarcticum A004/B2]
MRNFFLFCLALALVLVGAMALSHASLGFTASENAGIERVANMRTVELINSDDVEEDGISLKISSWQSDELILSIPKKHTGTNISLDFEVYLTNHRSTRASVTLGDIPTPELVNSDGKKLQPQGEAGRNQQSKPEEFGGYDCAFLEPDAPSARNYFGFGLKTKLSWHNDKLQLEISDRFGNLWFFDALKPETYQLRFSYDIPDGTASCYDPNTMRLRTIEGIQPGRGVTQFIKLRLVETIPTDNNAIEVDGVRFKIEMPKSVLTIPANQPGATTSVKPLAQHLTQSSPEKAHSFF